MGMRGCGSAGREGCSRVKAGEERERARQSGNLRERTVERKTIFPLRHYVEAGELSKGQVVPVRCTKANTLHKGMTYIVYYQERLLNGLGVRLACAFGMKVPGRRMAKGVTRTDRTWRQCGGAWEVLIGVTVHGFVVRGSRRNGRVEGVRTQTRSLDSRGRKAWGWLCGLREKVSLRDRAWSHSSWGPTAAKVW